MNARKACKAAGLAWVPGTQVLGGDLLVHTLIPLVHVSGRTAAGSQSKTGLGDITVGAGLGFHHSPRLHSVLALDLHLKTGSYDQMRGKPRPSQLAAQQLGAKGA